MAQKAHVPKFGGWDEEDIPYTAYFDNARQINNGTAKFNPNDPEENPEVFMAMMMAQQRRPLHQDTNFVSADHDHHNSISWASQPHRGRASMAVISRTNSQMSSSTEKPRRDGGGQTRHQRGGRNQNDNNINNNKVGFTSESGTERSSSDYSLLNKNKRQNGGYNSNDQRSDHYKKHNVSHSIRESTDSDHGHRGTNGDNKPKHHRATSIPKFGSWDVNDPKSGEVFTTIFDKVREEKHTNLSSSHKVLTISPPPKSNHLKDQIKREKSSSMSKICCCLFSSGTN